MIQSNEYPELHLPIVQSSVHNLCSKYKVISKVSLYKSGHDRQDAGINYVLVAEVPPLPQNCPGVFYETKRTNDVLTHNRTPPNYKDIDDDTYNLMQYYNEIGNDCSNIRKDIHRFYVSDNATHEDIESWMWFNIEPGDDASEYNDAGDIDFIQPASEVVLYPPSKVILYPENNQKNSFVLTGGIWTITFDKKTYPFKNNKAIQTMAEIIKSRGKKIGYIELGQITAGTAVTPNTDTQEPRRITTIDKTIHEINTFKKNIQEWYKTDKRPEREKELDEIKKTAKDDYGLLINKDANGITFKKTKWKEKSDAGYEKARKAVSIQVNNFKNKIEKDFPEIYNHFEAYLKIDNGYYYAPPKDFPEWEISI